jgi:hypothetical protein
LRYQFRLACVYRWKNKVSRNIRVYQPRNGSGKWAWLRLEEAVLSERLLSQAVCTITKHVHVSAIVVYALISRQPQHFVITWVEGFATGMAFNAGKFDVLSPKFSGEKDDFAVFSLA